MSGVYAPCAMVWQKIAPVNDWVSQGLVGIVNADLGSQAPPTAFLRALGHGGEALQVLLHGNTSSFRRNAVHTFGAHLSNRLSHGQTALYRMRNGTFSCGVSSA
jgi:hypothetical protein